MDILETNAYDQKLRRNTSFVLFLATLPFFLAVSTYFYLWIPESSPSVFAAGVKAAPVVSLALLVLSRNGGNSILGVAGGLVFSAVGDCCLIWPMLFIHGMASFAVAHLLYSIGFLSDRYSSLPSSSWTLVIYLSLWLLGGSVYAYLYPFLQNTLDADVLTPAVGMYIVLIIFMTILAVRTSQVLTLLGSLIFLASDFSLSLQHFKVAPPHEQGRTIIMTTYYLAQFLIAMGDIKVQERIDDFSKWKRS
ncbi:lysoplasmalogenase [Aplochiton taeniatus]